MKVKIFLSGFASFMLVVYLINTNLFSSKFNPEGPYLVAHRAVASILAGKV